MMTAKRCVPPVANAVDSDENTIRVGAGTLPRSYCVSFIVRGSAHESLGSGLNHWQLL